MEKRGSHHGFALRATAVCFGILGALGGLVHGVGEVLQGAVKPAGVFIASWAEGPIARYLDGDPALTLIPDMLATGISAPMVARPSERRRTAILGHSMALSLRVHPG